MKLSKLIRVRIDEGSGEAEVVLSNEFHQYSDTFQKDILMDVIADLQNAYEDIVPE